MKSYTTKLMPHQEDAKKRLQNQHGLILNWQVGSGKTIGAIAAADQFGKADVVVPASLRENFKKEIKAYKPTNRFAVKSYEKFVRNDTPISDTLIFDEAHRLRTSDSARSQKAQAVAASAKKVLLLTGTPIQNAPHEIAPLVNIAAGKQVLPTSEKAFNEHYTEHIKTNPNLLLRLLGFKRKDEVVAKNLNEFAAKVKPYVSNYVPENNPKMPKVTHKNVAVEMSPTQTAVYNALEKKLPGKIRQSIEEGLPTEKKDITQLNAFLSASRQISNTSERFYSTGKKEYSPKLLSIAKITKKSPGQTLIYSNYLESGVQPLSEILASQKIPHGIFTGKLKDYERKKLVDAYNKGKLKALIVSSSGGEGLDLKNTRQVHITEPHWNEAKIDQVIGRSIRFGSHDSLKPSQRTVDIYKYYSVLPEKRTGLFWLKKERPTSADEYLDNLSMKKKKLNEQFLQAIK